MKTVPKKNHLLNTVFASTITLLFFALATIEASDPDTALLNDGTSVRYDVVEGRSVHCSVTSPPIEECMLSMQSKSDQNELVVLFGNSQLHAVNDLKVKDKLIAERLYRALHSTGMTFLTVSFGNANMREILWGFKKVLEFGTPKSIIVAIVFDDFRELGLRPEMMREIGAVSGSGHMEGVDNQFVSLGETSENFLQGQLDETALIKARYELRYKIAVYLRSLRNSLFGITPSSIRPIIPARYKDNILALSELLALANEQKVNVIGYIAPIRSDIELPYAVAEYTSFKREVQVILEENGSAFYNFEALVPGEHWGLKQSTSVGNDLEIDYMHFTAEGHAILAQTLEEKLSENMNAF